MNVSTIYVSKGFCFINNNITTSKGVKIVPVDKAPKNSLGLGCSLYEMGIPDVRVYEFSNETLKSIPKIKTDDDALYAHIQSGDIFSKKPCKFYGQPPLCYYESIISKWGFKKVYVIAEDTKNPVINVLLGKYNATLIKENLTTTIGYILSAKNIVISYGTFVPSLLNLLPDDVDKRIFKYGPYFGRNANFRKKFYFTSVSDFYKENIMNGNWNNTQEQRKIMLDEKCGDEWFFHHAPLQS